MWKMPLLQTGRDWIGRCWRAATARNVKATPAWIERVIAVDAERARLQGNPTNPPGISIHAVEKHDGVQSVEKPTTSALGGNVGYYWRVPETVEGKRTWKQVEKPVQLTCSRRLQFSAGHRVVGHESKCRHLHGHNWVVWVHAQAWSLDPVGRVIDFGVIKEHIGAWIDERWDHGFILWHGDTSGMKAMETFSELEGIKQKVFYADWNPTAENLAKYLLTLSRSLLKDYNIDITKVTVYETENGVAEATI